MPDISMLGRKHPPSETPEAESDSEKDLPQPSSASSQPIVVPEACLACGKEKVTHSAMPCRHPCFCRACAMKMATGERCKVPSHPPSPTSHSMFVRYRLMVGV